MPRSARIIFPGYLHHITQRGNNRQKVFFEQKDFILYLKWTEKYALKYGVKIYAYCLMPNHVHFIAEPLQKDSFALMFHGIHTLYAQYFLKKTNGSGHVWQGRYYSCLLQGSHVEAALKYVEMNPVRAKISPKASEYRWSSAKAHLGKEYKLITLNEIDKFISIEDWSSYLEEKDDEDFLKDIRSATNKNIVLGNENFLEQIGKKIGRNLSLTRKGRPRKVNKCK